MIFDTCRITRLIEKGVGKTPLVSERADSHHSSGFLSMGEALREAGNAEFRRLATHFAECASVVGAVDSLKSQLSDKRSPNLRGQLLQIATAQRVVADIRVNPQQ